MLLPQRTQKDFKNEKQGKNKIALIETPRKVFIFGFTPKRFWFSL